jgi:hypothetical protein
MHASVPQDRMHSHAIWASLTPACHGHQQASRGLCQSCCLRGVSHKRGDGGLNLVFFRVKLGENLLEVAFFFSKLRQKRALIFLSFTEIVLLRLLIGEQASNSTNEGVLTSFARRNGFSKLPDLRKELVIFGRNPFVKELSRSQLPDTLDARKDGRKRPLAAHSHHLDAVPCFGSFDLKVHRHNLQLVGEVLLFSSAACQALSGALQSIFDPFNLGGDFFQGALHIPDFASYDVELLFGFTFLGTNVL